MAVVNQDAALTKASVPVNINGREYRVSPLVDVDIVELDEWVRTRIFETAINGIPEGAKPELRDAIIRVATQTASTASFQGSEGARMATGIDGVLRIMWQAVKRNHPGTSFVDFRNEVLADRPGGLLKLTTAFQRSNGVDPSKLPSKKVTARRQTGRR